MNQTDLNKADLNQFLMSLCLKKCSRVLSFFYLGFLSHSLAIHRTAGEERDFFNSTLPTPPALQTLRHYPSDYSRELTSAHS